MKGILVCPHSVTMHKSCITRLTFRHSRFQAHPLSGRGEWAVGSGKKLNLWLPSELLIQGWSLSVHWFGLNQSMAANTAQFSGWQSNRQPVSVPSLDMDYWRQGKLYNIQQASPSHTFQSSTGFQCRLHWSVQPIFRSPEITWIPLFVIEWTDMHGSTVCTAAIQVKLQFQQSTERRTIRIRLSVISTTESRDGKFFWP